MSAKSDTLKEVKKAAIKDFNNGLECNPQRHGAKHGSAWHTWYTREFQYLIEEAKRSKIQGMISLRTSI